LARWELASVAALLLMLCTVSAVGAQSPRNAAGLHIVVIEGEDAVNVVQQNTAVAPVVEVRDRNNQPVAGAVVRFAITRGRATFAGARTLAVTTDVAGRAAAAGLTPTGAGALRISANAAFQGQTAAVAIAQTNVMTAAQAAAMSGAGAAGGGGGAATGGAAGGAAGGSGSAVSFTTLGIIGGAAAGGAVIAQNVLGGPVAAYSGPFTMTPIVTRDYKSNVPTCTFISTITGTVFANLDQLQDPIKGTIRFEFSEVPSSPSGTCPVPSGVSIEEEGDFESPGNTIQMALTVNGTGSGGPVVRVYGFTGTLGDDNITGTVTLSYSYDNPIGIESYPATSAPAVLSKP
jgi:hypothetical protein